MVINNSFINKMLIAISAFFALNPYFLWKTYNVFGINIYRIVLILAAITSFFEIMMPDLSKVHRKSIVCILYYILFYLFQHINTCDGRFSIELGYGLAVLILCVLVMKDAQYKKDILKYFTIIFAVALISGLFFWILYVLKVQVPYSVLQPEYAGKVEGGFFYRHYLGCVFLDHKYNIEYFTKYKICGMFDEPGVIGTIGALLLVSNHFWENRKDKWLLIIFVGGALTFSLAFYIIIGVYIILKLFCQKKLRIDKISLYFIFIGISLLVIFLSISNIRYILNEILWEKMKSFISSLTTGGYRVPSAYWVNFQNLIIDNNKLMFGLGYGARDFQEFYGSSFITDLLVEYGIVGSIFYLMIPFVTAILTCPKGKIDWIFLFLFMLSAYQRPQFFNITYMVIFLGGIYNFDDVKGEHGEKEYNIKRYRIFKN